MDREDKGKEDTVQDQAQATEGVGVRAWEAGSTVKTVVRTPFI